MKLTQQKTDMNFKTKEMKQRPDLNKLSTEIHKANKAKGFHDKEISNGTLLMLVITELSEAVEADRKGKRADYAKYQTYVDAKNYVDMNIAFEDCFKDTLEDELADAVIRLLDLAGLRSLDIESALAFRYKKNDKTIEQECIVHFGEEYKHRSFPEYMFFLIEWMVRENSSKLTRMENMIACMIMAIYVACEDMYIDLWVHVELKLKYNKTRKLKHGKAY